VLPDDNPAIIMGQVPPRYRRYLSGMPPEYRSGIGNDGLKALKKFVEQGGRLVALGGASEFAIDKFGLSVRDVLDNLESKEFFCPGSTVKVTFDNTNPLAYGMPEDGYVLFWNSPAFAVIPGQHNEDYTTVVRYKDKDLLQSGWLIGEDHLAEKSGMICAKQGQGQIVLIGFRTQLRSQTDGTFKLLFNALYK
jgi:hypothetical protein